MNDVRLFLSATFICFVIVDAVIMIIIKLTERRQQSGTESRRRAATLQAVIMMDK